MKDCYIIVFKRSVSLIGVLAVNDTESGLSFNVTYFFDLIVQEIISVPCST